MENLGSPMLEEQQASDYAQDTKNSRRPPSKKRIHSLVPHVASFA
jgi:hypothetical protein